MPPIEVDRRHILFYLVQFLGYEDKTMTHEISYKFALLKEKKTTHSMGKLQPFPLGMSKLNETHGSGKRKY